MITFLTLLVGMVVSWSTVAQAESPTCWSSAVCYKRENIETEWLKIFPRPNCTSKSNISKIVEYTRIQKKFNRSIVDFFKGLGSFATNACSSCNYLYQGIEIDDSRHSYSDTEECFAPIVCGVDGRTIADYIQIRPFPSCNKEGNVFQQPHESSGEMESLFNSSREYVAEELQNFLFKNCSLCQTTRIENVIATLTKSLWKPSIDTKKCYVPVICAEEDNSSENWMRFPDPDCKSANLTLLSEKPEKIFTSILERARVEIQDIVEQECRKSRDEHITTPEISQREAKMASLASSGWYLIENGSRQYAYKLFLVYVPYETARNKCSELDARLACEGMRISTVRNLVIKEIVRPVGVHPWIGLDDLQNQDRWMWADGVQSTRSNTDWAPSEPNGANERCVHMFHGYNYRLNDNSCTQNYQYLCEKVL